MFIKLSAKWKRAFTLVEVLVSTAILGIVGVAICSVYMTTTRAFISLANYAQLDQINRNAMDYITREIRQAREVVSVTTNSNGQIISVAMINFDGATVNYTFDSGGKRFTRWASDGSGTKTLLSNCKLLQFNVYQRTAITNKFDEYPQLGPNDAIQVVQLTWQASKSAMGGIANSENIQTARVVIRNQHKFGN